MRVIFSTHPTAEVVRCRMSLDKDFGKPKDLEAKAKRSLGMSEVSKKHFGSKRMRLGVQPGRLRKVKSCRTHTVTYSE